MINSKMSLFLSLDATMQLIACKKKCVKYPLSHQANPITYSSERMFHGSFLTF
jgi:hypothetical protein